MRKKGAREGSQSISILRQHAFHVYFSLAIRSGFLRLKPVLPSQIYKESCIYMSVSGGSAEREGRKGGKKEEWEK